MREYVCKQCNNVWKSKDARFCPRCGSDAVSSPAPVSHAGVLAYAGIEPATSLPPAGDDVKPWGPALLTTCIAAAVFVAAASLLMFDPYVSENAMWLALTGVGFGAAAAFLGLSRLYAAWQAVQPLRRVDAGEAHMPTPGQAVGFLFIPFFNLYWVFTAYAGLLRRANKLAQARRIQVAYFPVNLAVATAIVLLAFLACVAAAVVSVALGGFTKWIPLLGGPLFLAMMILFYLLVRQADRIVQTLGAVQADAAPGPPLYTKLVAALNTLLSCAGAVMAGGILFALWICATGRYESGGEWEFYFGCLTVVSAVFFLVAFAFAVILLRRAWEAVQPLRHIETAESSMPAPGQVVGFLFIPFFNFYWVFIAYVGLLRRANHLARAWCLSARPFREGLALATAILSALYFASEWTPFVGLELLHVFRDGAINDVVLGWVPFAVFGLPTVILFYFFMNEVIRLMQVLSQSPPLHATDRLPINTNAMAAPIVVLETQPAP